MPIALTKFNCWPLDLGLKKHDLSSDAFFMALSNTAPSAGNTVLGDITQISPGNGYSAGGFSLTATGRSFSGSGGIARMIVADYTLSASGGNIATFRYPFIYNNTHPSKPLVGWGDIGAAITITDGTSWLFDFDPTDGVIVIQ
jgi:hypothetical protein